MEKRDNELEANVTVNTGSMVSKPRDALEANYDYSETFSNVDMRDQEQIAIDIFPDIVAKSNDISKDK